MPSSQTEGFIKPTNQELNNWQDLFELLLNIKIEKADSLIQENFSFYQLSRFTDTGFNGNIYFLLKEKNPVTKGWGTFIVNPNNTRPICFEIPHPAYDLNTHIEGTELFRRTNARFLIMAGTHRCANSEVSPCDGSFSGCNGSRYAISDMAHTVLSPFQIAHETFYELFPNDYSFSIHGNSRSSCEDIFLSNGRSNNSKTLLFDIKNSLLAQGGLSVAVAGDGTSSCSLVGSTNVQGRFTNGSTAPCTMAASTANGNFIHVEQRRRVRDNFSLYTKLIDAINQKIDISTTVNEDPLNSLEETSIIPNQVSLFPNPFQSEANVEYHLPSNAYVSIKVYNLRGQVIRVLEDMIYRDKGVYRIKWDGRNQLNMPLPNGIYFVQLFTGKTNSVSKLFLLK